MTPRLLDLFCGAGGAAKGYSLAGFDVVGVDLQPQPRYPFEFLQGDALDFPLEGFDVVHASPPCQRWTDYGRRPGHVHEHPDLIGSMRERLRAWGGPWIIENVPGAPLRNPITLCGSSFGLDVRRHRCFESNAPLMSLPCNHAAQRLGRFPGATNRAPMSRATVEVGVWRIPLEVQQRAMGGLDWMTLEELSEAIPPAYTEHVGGYLMAELRARAAA